MTEPKPMSDGQEPVVINWSDIEKEVEGLTGDEGGAVGAGEGLTPADLQGVKQVGKKFLVNLNKALDAQKDGEAKRGRKQAGWMGIALPFIEAGIITGIEMFQAGKKSKK